MFVCSPAWTAGVSGGHCCPFSACSSSWKTPLPLLAPTWTPAPWNVQGETDEDTNTHHPPEDELGVSIHSIIITTF